MAIDRRSVPSGVGWYIASGAEIWNWVAERTGGKFKPHNSQAIGLVRKDKIVAGAVFENYNGKSIMFHLAIEGRLTPAFLFALFRYPFVTCNVDKLLATILSTNVKSIKLAKNFGFIEEAKIKDAHPDGDILFFTMLKNDCRFINYVIHIRRR